MIRFCLLLLLLSGSRSFAAPMSEDEACSWILHAVPKEGKFKIDDSSLGKSYLGERTTLQCIEFEGNSASQTFYRCTILPDWNHGKIKPFSLDKKLSKDIVTTFSAYLGKHVYEIYADIKFLDIYYNESKESSRHCSISVNYVS